MNQHNNINNNIIFSYNYNMGIN